MGEGARSENNLQPRWIHLPFHCLVPIPKHQNPVYKGKKLWRREETLMTTVYKYSVSNFTYVVSILFMLFTNEEIEF